MKKNKLFVGEDKPHGTVVLNWHGTPEEEFTFFAEAFHRVAQESVTALRKNPRFGKYGDPIDNFLAYPIVFLYRHALELYMKAVILAGSGMLVARGMGEIDQDRLRGTHNLEVLGKDLERVFDAYDWGWDLEIPHFRSVDDFRTTIGEFAAVDKGSHAFRYPINTQGGASLTSHFGFNLFEFCEVLDTLFPIFQGAAMGAYEELRSEWEATAEAQGEMENSDYHPG